MRILLAVILLSRPDIMLLDEPTNHLDTESMEWLESYLRDYPGTLITVSHDRTFLDKITTSTAELSQGRITLYKGNYSYYLAEKEKRRLALLKEMESQKAEIRKIREFVERFRYKATKAAQVQSRVKMLEKIELVRCGRGRKNRPHPLSRMPAQRQRCDFRTWVVQSLWGQRSVFQCEFHGHTGKKSPWWA